MKLYKIFSAVAVSGLLLSSCIEETFPESDSATAEQIGASASALEASLNGIPSQMVAGYLVYGGQTHETDMAYPQFMIAQTELLGDMYALGSDSGYDWYRNYNTFSSNFGDQSYFSFLPWFTLYKFIKSDNDIIGVVDIDDETVSDLQKGYAGVAYACRAFNYYMLTVFYEPKANIYTDCSKVLGMTVPFVTETTTADDAKNNPRASHQEMMDFILSDLDKAERCLSKVNFTNKMLPNLAVVYGIKAKVYLWDEKYAEAAKYARMAIDEAKAHGAVPMTAAEMENPSTGFAQATPGWMWYLHYSAENMGNLCNFTGWMSGEADWGYSSLTCPGIDRSLYDRIPSTDIRKRLFLDPKKTDFYQYKTVRDEAFLKSSPAYLALKFRCLNGDWETYSVGAAVDVPVMRIEEMMLIEAEAVGMSQGISAGAAKLNEFVKNYRDPNYNYEPLDERNFQLEVLAQMRIEFWGEGNAFPSAKRIQPDVIQNYDGTNAPADIFKINCKGIKPNWNFVIPKSEVNANSALKDTNNPDPTSTVKGPTAVGTFAPGK